MTTPSGNAPYDAQFYAEHVAGSLQSARLVAEHVLTLVKPASVVDVGCGTGAWLRAFREAGVPHILGLDGAYVPMAALLIDPKDFRAVDLSTPFEVGERFDLAICVEVAEHLPTRASAPLVRALTRAAPLVLFSAALPGQAGTDHRNLQWPGFWRGLFAEQGYVRLDCLRPRIWQDRRIDWWYRQNVVLFAAPEALAAWEPLRMEQERGGNDLELIHESVLGRYESILGRYACFSGLLRELPAAAWRAVKRRLS